MSNKKNLLNEAQIRQFMKLASLQPLTPGFVEGLSEDKPFTAKKEKPGEDLRKGAEVRGAEGTEGKEGEGDAYVDVKKEGKDEDLEEVHGRGANEYHKAGQHRGGGVKLDEEGMVYRDDPEAELGATEDELGAEDHVADEEGAEIDDLEGEVDAEADAGAEASLTVAQVVDAIESALQDLLPNEEVEAEYVGDEEGDDAAAPEFAPEGDEVVADVELGGEELTAQVRFMLNHQGLSPEELEQALAKEASSIQMSRAVPEDALPPRLYKLLQKAGRVD